MSDRDSTERREGVDRRKFIAGVGAGVTAGLAGCGSGGDTGETPGAGGTTAGGAETDAPDDTDEETEMGGETETDTPQQEITRGGQLTIGQAQPPQHLNVMKGGNAYGSQIIEKNYTFGTMPHPDTADPIPWGFTDWTLKPENAKENPSSPTIVAELRDDLTFADGKKVTAEDAHFTYQFMMEQNTTGYFQPADTVVEVGLDKDKGNTVNFFMNGQDATWSNGILRYPILPKHVWEGVSDYTQYSPRQENTFVGSGPLTITDFNWPNWIELEMRPREEVPYNGDDRYEFLHPEGPFIDGVRYQLFQSRSSLFQSVLDGNIDQTIQTVKEQQAVKATNQDHLDVMQTESSGYEFHAWNMRRVPFDDVAFRQFLVKALNQKWLVEKLHKNIGVKAGSYHTSTLYESWRPPEPEELMDSDDPYEAGTYEGIPIPDLSFPGDTLQYGDNIRQQDVDALREFLLNHPEAKHDYSLGEAQSDSVSAPDGQAIYVNGKPIGEAHTNNKGEPGQGDLEMSQGPPAKDPLSYPRADNWIKALQRTGLPITRSIEPWETQYQKIYLNEEFDMYEQSWPSLDWPQTHLEWMFHSSFADLEQGDSDDDVAQWNSMSYTALDDTISEIQSLMDHDERRPLVKKAYAQLYHDSPHLNSATPINLVPVTKRFTGRIGGPTPWAGVGIIYTPLNVRLAEGGN